MNEQYLELLETLEEAIAHPHSTIVKHDRERAAIAMLIFAHFLTKNFQGGEDQFRNIAIFLGDVLTEDEKKAVFPSHAHGGSKNVL